MADCGGDPVDLTQRGLRIGAIFIIMVASFIGAVSPIVLARQTKMHVPKFTFFICKYVGTGVIIATAWMHLLEPAVDNLGDECLAPRLGDYPWAFFIGLFTILLMFLIELLAARGSFEEDTMSNRSIDSESDPTMDMLALKTPQRKKKETDAEACPHTDADGNGTFQGPDQRAIPGRPDDVSYPPGGMDHLAHAKEHEEGDSHHNLSGQLTAIFILEFGVVFHSIFIGLTLGTTDELVILLIVLVFHQLFEGLGLGSRLAVAHWPEDKKWLPYFLACLFALATPVGIAAGMGARTNNADTQKLVNGIFDAISAGILMYTGLVELLAHEFMFNPHMRRASLKIQLFAYGCILFGAGVMATLAEWA